MNRLLPFTLAAGLAALLSGCAASTTPGTRYALTEQPWGSTTARFLSLCNPNPDVGPVTCNVILTGDRADEEAWLFEARLRVVSGLGIPYGREPVDYLVVGSHSHCEQVRAAMRARPHILYDEETPPSEPCTGPFYFRRAELPAR